MDIKKIKKKINLKGYYLIKSNFTEVSSLLAFGKKFGTLKKINSLRTHKESNFINVVERSKKHKNFFFGDVWHSDHAYDKRFPKYTMIYLKYVDKNPSSTYFLNRFDICANLNKEEKNYLLNKTFELTPPKKQIQNLKKKGLKIHKRNVKGLIKFQKKIKIEISPYHVQRKSNIIKKIFKKFDLKKNYDEIKLKKNDIIIWDNRLIFHKAEKIAQKRIIYRLMIK